MANEKDKIEIVSTEIKSKEQVQDILNEGIQCTALIEVGEAVDAVLKVFGNIDNTDFLRNFVRVLFPYQHKHLQEFLTMLSLSIVMTMVGAFSERESETVGKA